MYSKEKIYVTKEKETKDKMLTKDKIWTKEKTTKDALFRNKR